MTRKLTIVLCILVLFTGCAKKEVGFSLSAVSSMVKVPLEPDSAVVSTDTARISAAGGEYEAFQVLITPKDTVGLSGVTWEISGLKGESGQLEAGNIEINPVGYVQTTVTSRSYHSALGWWPDPLLRLDSLSVPAGERQPLWVTVYVPPGTPRGTYRGRVTVSVGSTGEASLPVELRVWGFDIPHRPSIKTLTWVGSLEDFGGNGREQRKAFYEMLLAHRLGPGGRVELDEDMLGFCMERGMNAFLLDIIPNLARRKQDDYTQSYKDSLTAKLERCVERFGPRGWLDGLAYVYNYDEVDRRHWPLAKEMYELVKGVSPQLKVLQCLNIPEGVSALAGYADTWDVYVAQYEKSGVAQRVAEGDEAWLAVCCYPADHPNMFLEYPAIDSRILGWICHHTGVTGFEYWSPNHWNGNDSPPELRGGWKANTFRNYNGDGYLTYPGPGGRPLSSVRLANLRDGFEDYEYLHLLDRLGGDQSPAEKVVSGPTEYSSDPELLDSVREEIARVIEQAATRQ